MRCSCKTIKGEMCKRDAVTNGKCFQHQDTKPEPVDKLVRGRTKEPVDKPKTKQANQPNKPKHESPEPSKSILIKRRKSKGLSVHFNLRKNKTKRFDKNQKI